MHEIEIKAHVSNIHDTETRLSHIADFARRCVKDDSYWTCAEKTLRIRRECTDGTERVFVTHKSKQYVGMVEAGRELECELKAASLPACTEMLERLGMRRTSTKHKDTRVFFPHKGVLADRLVEDAVSVSIELSHVPPIGDFLEIEVLYPDEGADSALAEKHIDNAQTIFNTLLTALDIPKTAIETLPYQKLLKDAIP